MTNYDYIMNFTDGGITNIETNGEYSSGCPTCDYGAERINYIELETTNYVIRAALASGYHFAIGTGYDGEGYNESEACDISIQDLVNILDIKNPEQMTEREFINYFTNAIITRTDYVDIRVTRRNMSNDWCTYDADFVK